MLETTRYKSKFYRSKWAVPRQRLLHRAIGASHVTVLPNGASIHGRNSSPSVQLNESWQPQLHALAPSAQQITLWSETGVEVLWTRRDGTSGFATPCIGCSPLYVTTGSNPFIWPTSHRPRRVVAADESVHAADAQLEAARPRRGGPPRSGGARFHPSHGRTAPRTQQDRLVAPFKAQRALPTKDGEAPHVSGNAWLPLKASRRDMSMPKEEERVDAERVHAAARRIASLARLSVELSEPIQVVHYNTTEYYYYHLDNEIRGTATRQRAPRVLTALFYLNDGFDGGHTNFPLAAGGHHHLDNGNAAGGRGGRRPSMRAATDVLRAFGPCQTTRGLSVRPRRGDVLLFYNAQPNSPSVDYWPWHGSCEVTRGEKWAANLWFHAEARDMAFS